MSEKREPTAKEIAQRGGQSTRDRYGADHFAEIGRRGGRALRDSRGKEFFRAIGKKGGKATAKLNRASTVEE